MKHLALVALVVGCSSSSGSKQPTAPTTPEPTAASTAPAVTEPAAKQEPAPPPPPDTGGYRLIAPSALTWQPADPAKPGAIEIAVVSGDLQKGGSFFLKLAPGTKPGLHTHTADYHGLVISGTHKHWLPGEEKKAKLLAPGSYWFQPGGQPHGDECTGTEPCVLYLMTSAAWDVAPAPNAKPGKPGAAFVKPRKDYKMSPFDPKQPDGPKLAIVDGDPKTGPVALLLETPPNSNAGLHSHTSEYHALVIDGAPAHWLPHEAHEGEPLAAGTYWFQPGGYDHGDRCTGTTPCHVFVMMPKALDFKPAAKK